jgi:L-asparaginase
MPADIENLIFKYLPEIHRIAEVKFEIAFNMDSANIQIHHWQKLTEVIVRNYEDFDGFVIIHGTDAMVYSACALSFMLEGLSKPVILTGSQRPLALIRSDARSNLINSIELATQAIPEVSIFFGTNLFRGNRSIKISSTRYEAFASPNFSPLAEVGLDISLSDYIRKPGKNLQVHREFDDGVFCFRFYPNLIPSHLNFLIESDIRGVVLEALGVGNVAIKENSLIQWIHRMDDAGKVVVINSQSPFGKIDLGLYECGKMIEEAGGISAGDMTTSASLIKLMFLLGKFQGNQSLVKSQYLAPLAGEVTNYQQRT